MSQKISVFFPMAQAPYSTQYASSSQGNAAMGAPTSYVGSNPYGDVYAGMPNQAASYAPYVSANNTADTETLQKFHWGAFFLYPYWGFTNGTWWAFFLLLIPPFYLVGALICGFKGYQWAWKRGKWTSFKEFKIVQHTWTTVAFTSLIFSVSVGLLCLIIEWLMHV
ncbi:MAG: hypothetical protein LUD17_11305 [Bacteroidales bacterium]|nr:hypothetical protein [Bacteroidales bacterium]